jgi:hypothetical protein
MLKIIYCVLHCWLIVSHTTCAALEKRAQRANSRIILLHVCSEACFISIFCNDIGPVHRREPDTEVSKQPLVKQCSSSHFIQRSSYIITKRTTWNGLRSPAWENAIISSIFCKWKSTCHMRTLGTEYVVLVEAWSCAAWTAAGEPVLWVGVPWLLRPLDGDVTSDNRREKS